jgi:hypothetical protein
MKTAIRMLAALILLLAADTLAVADSQTARVGGSGGDYSVRMECGPDAFVVGVHAAAGQNFPSDLNLVRELRFTCRGFGANTSETSPSGVSPRYGLGNETRATVSCPDGRAMTSLAVRAGLYIDAILEIGCVGPGGQEGAPLALNVGGRGGSYQSLLCPSGEALYRIDARAGDAVDSLKGYCRRFPPLQIDPNAPVFDQAPAQGAVITLSAASGGEIGLRAHGVTGPVTLNLQVTSPYASRFALVMPRTAIAPSIAPLPGAQLTPIAAATSTSRALRVTGPVYLNPLAGSPVVPIALTVRDGAGRTAVRTFQVYLK